MKIFIYFMFLLLLSSCSHFHRLFHPNDYIKKTYTNDYQEIYDDLHLKVDKDKSLTYMPGNANHGRRIQLSQTGDTEVLPVGTAVSLSLSGFDFDRNMIVIESTEKGNDISISVRDKYETITLSNKCQTIEIFNIDFLPIIEIDKQLDKQQIIVTPIFNNDIECSHLGYQVRYGDQTYGSCYKEAGKIYQIFTKCVKSKQSKVKSTKKYKKTGQPCWEDILFGIPCP